MTSCRFRSLGFNWFNSSWLIDSRQSGGSGSVSKSESPKKDVVGKEWEEVTSEAEEDAMVEAVTADRLPAMSCIEVAGLSKEELKNYQNLSEIDDLTLKYAHYIIIKDEISK